MKKRVVIVGGGFGGLRAAKSMGKDQRLSITVIDRRNYHLFQPLLYQVAMAGLSPAEIAVPIRSILSKYKNIEVILDQVEKIDRSGQRVITASAEYAFDYLILACGAKHSYFGHEDWEIYAPGLKTLEQATEIRRRILCSFEEAEKEPSVEKREILLTFIVVGGGPTGVELAGAIGEISRYSLAADFRRVQPANAKILLVEGGDRILSTFSETLSQQAVKDLGQLGVQVRTHSRVTEVGPEGVKIGEEFIPARTVLWAAGVKPSSLNQQFQEYLDAQGRVVVRADLSLPDHHNIFVIGDQACAMGAHGKCLPGLAPVAIQQGAFVAELIKKELSGKSRKSFQYVDKGQMATVGRKKAVLEIGSLKMKGLLAWLAWLFVHIYYLIGFKNRFFVFYQWAWNYFTYRRGARLIVDKEWQFFKKTN